MQSLLTKPYLTETASFYAGASEEVRPRVYIYASCVKCLFIFFLRSEVFGCYVVGTELLVRVRINASRKKVGFTPSSETADYNPAYFTRALSVGGVLRW